jgi:hypothetical protein
MQFLLLHANYLLQFLHHPCEWAPIPPRSIPAYDPSAENQIKMKDQSKTVPHPTADVDALHQQLHAGVTPQEQW